MWSNNLRSEIQFGFIFLNQTMTFFILKETYLVHFKINFNDFCGFGCVRCIITKYFWGSKIIKQWPKILNSKLQIGFISLNRIVTPSISKGIFWSFQNQFEQFLWLWMHLVKDYKISLSLIDNGLIFKYL